MSVVVRRSAVIATLGQDERGLVTARVLRNWAGQTHPEKIPVYYAVPAGVYEFGHCVRFWRDGAELWAELEIQDARADLWPDPTPPGLYCDVMAGLKGQNVMMLAVLCTAMPRGLAGALFARADANVRRQRAAN